MVKLWLAGFFFLCFAMTAIVAVAAPSPVGVWRTYDLEGIPRSLMQMSVVNGQLQGKLVKILPAPGEKGSTICTKCAGNLRNKSLNGMVVIWGLTPGEEGRWEAGYVLDTDHGKTYRCQLTVSADNQTLHLRAYAGSPLFGATVDWERVK